MIRRVVHRLPFLLALLMVAQVGSDGWCPLPDQYAERNRHWYDGIMSAIALWLADDDMDATASAGGSATAARTEPTRRGVNELLSPECARQLGPLTSLTHTIAPASCEQASGYIESSTRGCSCPKDEFVFKALALAEMGSGVGASHCAQHVGELVELCRQGGEPDPNARQGPVVTLPPHVCRFWAAEHGYMAETKLVSSHEECHSVCGSYVQEMCGKAGQGSSQYVSCEVSLNANVRGEETEDRFIYAGDFVCRR